MIGRLGHGYPQTRVARPVSLAMALGVCIITLVIADETRAERLPIKSYTTADGLAHDAVNRIVPDSRGFLWLCTAAGLSRFDGYSFLNFGIEHGLPSASVNDLLESRTGTYWIATNEGLIRFNPAGLPQRGVIDERDPRAAHAMFVAIPSSALDRRAKAVTVLREAGDGTIWVGTKRGLYRLIKRGGQHALDAIDVALPNDFPGQREIVDLLEDTDGALWVATPFALHRRWADGTADAYPMTGRLGDVSDLFEDHTGHLWVASRVGGIARLRRSAARTPPAIESILGSREGLPHEWVTEMFETTDRRIWVGTANGLAELLPSPDSTGRRFRSYTTRNGLSHGYLSGLTEDAWGNLWLSTTNAGVMKVARNGFTTYGRQDGIESVGAVFRDGAGHVCFRAYVLSTALEREYRGRTRSWLQRNADLAHLRFGCVDGDEIDWFYPTAVADPGWATRAVTLQTRNGEWWLGTGEGLLQYGPVAQLSALTTARPVTTYTTGDGLASNQVFGLFEDSRGDVWVSTIAAEKNGLARWERNARRLLDLAGRPGLPPLISELPRSFGEDAFGAVWIGFSGSVARYSAGQFRLFGAADGVPPGAVNFMHLDHRRRLWLASSQGGVIRIDNPDSSHPAFVGYTKANGLSSDDIEVITEDSEGHLFLGGGNGIDRLDPQTGRVTHFTIADGLTPGILTSAYREPSGAIWFGLTTGLARVVPAASAPTSATPTWITGVRIAGIPQPLSARGERRVELPQLASRQNQLQIDFVGVGLRTGEGIRYQYRLEGADADWSALTEQRTVTYATLAPGRYTFLVRAVNADGVGSDEPAAIAFTILPPFWLRGWFVTLALAAVALTVHGFYRWRAARLLEVANLRTRIAADLHDDIGANLTRIALLSEVAQRAETAVTEGAAIAPPLMSIARIARESVAAMSDIVWAINPARDSVADLTGRMRRYAEDLFTSRGIEVRFTTAGLDEHARLGADVRRDLLLIFKEAANNAARHSGCSRIEITLEVHRARVALLVADNGGGFDTALESEGHGLISLKRRASRLKGTLAIVSSPQSGTSVRLVVAR